MARIDDELDRAIADKIHKRETDRESGTRRIFFTKATPFKDVTFVGDYFEIFYEGEKTLSGEVIGEGDTPAWTRCQIKAVDNVRGGEGVFSVSENDYYHIREVLKAKDIDYKNALGGVRLKMRRDPTGDPMVYKYSIEVEAKKSADENQEPLPREGPKINFTTEADYDEVVAKAHELRNTHPKWGGKMITRELQNHFISLNKTIDDVVLEAVVEETAA